MVSKVNLCSIVASFFSILSSTVKWLGRKVAQICRISSSTTKKTNDIAIQELIKKIAELPETTKNLKNSTFQDAIIKNEKGIILAKNNTNSQSSRFEGIAALPANDNGEYQFCFYPGPHGFSREKLNQFIHEAAEKLAVNPQVKLIAVDILELDDLSRDNFKEWQKEVVKDLSEIDQKSSTLSKNKIKRSLAHLPFDKNSAKLAYSSQDQIQSCGGIVLTKNTHQNGNFFSGIVLYPNDDDKSAYDLHLCPGGGNLEFNQQQINDLMEEAVEYLAHQANDAKIIGIASIIGRHPGNTMDCFIEWQKQNKLL